KFAGGRAGHAVIRPYLVNRLGLRGDIGVRGPRNIARKGDGPSGRSANLRRKQINGVRPLADVRAKNSADDLPRRGIRRARIVAGSRCRRTDLYIVAGRSRAVENAGRGAPKLDRRAAGRPAILRRYADYPARVSRSRSHGFRRNVCQLRQRIVDGPDRGIVCDNNRGRDERNRLPIEFVALERIDESVERASVRQSNVDPIAARNGQFVADGEVIELAVEPPPAGIALRRALPELLEQKAVRVGVGGPRRGLRECDSRRNQQRENKQPDSPQRHITSTVQAVLPLSRTAAQPTPRPASAPDAALLSAS